MAIYPPNTLGWQILSYFSFSQHLLLLNRVFFPTSLTSLLFALVSCSFSYSWEVEGLLICITMALDVSGPLFN